jgi:CRISPR/Cas system-associated endoribonuclease Cas2
VGPLLSQSVNSRIRAKQKLKNSGEVRYQSSVFRAVLQSFGRLRIDL